MSDYRRTRLRRPYNDDGSTAFPARGFPGVYLIYRVSDHPLTGERQELRYVGFGGTDVYKAMYRHFQTWNDRQAALGQRSERIVYKLRSNIRVRVIYCRSAAQARELERALILKHKPTDNPDKLEQYELTDAGEAIASEALSSDWAATDEAPF